VNGAYVFKEPRPITKLFDLNGIPWAMVKGSDSGVEASCLRRTNG